MLLLDMTQFNVVKGKRLGSVLVKQFSRAQPGWGLRGSAPPQTPRRLGPAESRAPPQNIIRLRCVRCIRYGVLSHPKRLQTFPGVTKYCSGCSGPLCSFLGDQFNTGTAVARRMLILTIN